MNLNRWAPGIARRRTFTRIFHRNEWGSEASVSGPGSDLDQTAVLRERLPDLLRSLHVRTMVDVPCGDFGWMHLVDLPVESYIGLDVVPQIVRRCADLYGEDGVEFRVADIVKRRPPKVDLVFCRDLLVHLSDRDVRKALRNIIRSGSRWLLTTTFT